MHNSAIGVEPWKHSGPTSQRFHAQPAEGMHLTICALQSSSSACCCFRCGLHRKRAKGADSWHLKTARTSNTYSSSLPAAREIVSNTPGQQAPDGFLSISRCAR